MALKIGLDIDGVVANSFPVFREELNRHYGKNIEKIDQYDMTKVYDVAWDELHNFFDQHMEYLFLKAEPMEGAVQTIGSWLDAGHEIVFITARKCGAEETVTLKWLDNHRLPRDHVIFVGSTSKTFAVREFELDIFVEDFMGNALEIAAMGVPVLLLDAPYNVGKVPTGVTRCHNWKDLECYIREFEQKKA